MRRNSQQQYFGPKKRVAELTVRRETRQFKAPPVPPYLGAEKNSHQIHRCEIRAELPWV